ncbi:MAG: hypothetical protein ABSE86_13395 [Bryobacteraceae bacterium]|jgi:hypothetical protein
MAVIKCTLEQDGKLRVLSVAEFQPGDTIELEEAIEVCWSLQGGYQPLISRGKCLAVKSRFSANDSAIPNVMPNPCPGN